MWIAIAFIAGLVAGYLLGARKIWKLWRRREADIAARDKERAADLDRIMRILTTNDPEAESELRARTEQIRRGEA